MRDYKVYYVRCVSNLPVSRQVVYVVVVVVVAREVRNKAFE